MGARTRKKSDAGVDAIFCKRRSFIHQLLGTGSTLPLIMSVHIHIYVCVYVFVYVLTETDRGQVVTERPCPQGARILASSDITREACWVIWLPLHTLTFTHTNTLAMHEHTQNTLKTQHSLGNPSTSMRNCLSGSLSTSSPPSSSLLYAVLPADLSCRQ